MRGFNDLATAFPGVALEWHGDNPKSPGEVTPYSNTKVKWLCSLCDNTWEARIFNRTLHGTGCPRCCNSASTSRKEKDLGEAVRRLFPRYTWEENNRSILGGKELDLH